VVRADERLFTYVQEAEVLPKGGPEFEQWMTHRRGKADGEFSRWDFREEREYSPADKLSVAGYLNFKSTHSASVSGIDTQDGIEGRNHREFPPSIGFDNQKQSAWFVGPNVHYARNNWWATLTVLPQVHGSPSTRDGLQLKELEKIEVRLIAGVNF